MSELNERYKNFTMLIADIYRSIAKIKDREMAALGLKGIHATVLFYLFRKDGQTEAEICRTCGEDKAAISRATAHLKKNGFIVPDTGYRRPLELTEKGRTAAKFVADKTEEYVLGASSELTAEELGTFYKALFSIEQRLREE